eukprot:Skav206272  [mRNA]  locus=scaffold888:387625:392637:+ [translate_table: standard]
MKSTITLSCCTVNVNTLYHQPSGFSGKTAFVMEQLAHHHINVVGVQESRTPPGQLTSGCFLRLCSGALDGNHGLELWINLEQPYAHRDGRPMFFKQRDFVVVHAEPTFLLVHCTATGLDVWFFVAHAPHSGKSDQHCSDWWSQANALLERFVAGREVIVFIDANATSGRALDALADVSAGALRNAEHLESFCVHNDLQFAAHTPAHSGTLCTWTAPDGSYSKDVDHLLIPATWLASCTWSQVLEELIVTPGHHDHKPLAAQFGWTTWTPIPAPSSRPTMPDRTRIRANPSLQHHLASLPVAAWDEDIGTEVQKLTSSLQEALSHHCGRAQRGPRKAFVQTQTWELRTQCLQHKRALRQTQHRYNTFLRQVIFQAWRDGQATSAQLSQKSKLRLAHARAVALYERGTTQLRHFLRRDKQCHLRATLEQFTDETPAHDILRQLRPFRGSSNAKGFQARPLPQIDKADGSPCDSYDELVNRWTEFFCSMEGGTTMSDSQLQQLWRQNLQQNQQCNLDFTLRDLPTLSDLEQACARVKPGKAAGPDHIPPELLHYYPSAMAKLLYPQLLKLLAHGQESLLHKGGRLVAVWKNKGSQKQCEMYRSLLISSHVGKVVHRALRQHQASVYELYMQRYQLGGRRGVAVAAASHQAKAFLRYCKRKGSPVAVAYLDLKEAYYRILRPLAFGDVVTDAELAQFLARLNLPADCLDDLRAHVQQPSAMMDAAAPRVVQRVARALHQDTHWWVDGQRSVCRTTQGSRPGDSWADIVFGYIWARLLKELEQAMESHGVLAHLPACDVGLWTTPLNTKSPFLGPCWMDDLAVVIEADCCETLLTRTSLTMGLILDACYSFGFTPNTAMGKTEIMVQLRGRKKQKIRKHLYGADGHQVLPVVCEHGSHEVHVTPDYLHLGGIHHHSGSDRKDMQRRLGLAHAAFNANRKLVFHNAAIPLSKRVALFETLVLSKLLFGAETWVPSSDSDLLHWASGVHRLYRRLLRKRHDEHVPTVALFVEAGLPSGPLLLRRARLRYMASLYQPWAQQLWSSIKQDYDWLQLCLQDLDWVWQQLRGSSTLPDPRLDEKPWEDLWRQQPRRWKGLVKRAFAHHSLQLRRRWETHQFHCRIRLHLTEHCLLPPDPPPSVDHHSPQDLHACLQCARGFRSKPGLFAHLCKAHGRISPLRILFDGTQCPSCLTEYHTTSKMYSHLYNSHACRRDLEARQVYCEPLPGRGSLVARGQAAVHDNLAPIELAQGPLPAPPGLPGPAPWFWTVSDVLERYLLDLEGVPEDEKTELLVGAQVKAILQRYPLTWQEGLQLLDRMLTNYGEEDAEIAGVPRSTLASVVAMLREPTSWHFFATDPATAPLSEEALVDLPLWLSTLMAGPCLAAPLPKPMPTERIVLHLFSGRRRRGDIQDYVEQFGAKMDLGPIVVVSVDIICDLVWGNVTDPKTRAFWLSAITQGWVAATVAGPPCETWTVARHQHELDNSGPRPVRYADALWGHDALRLRELRQLLVGNELLEFTIETLLATWFVGHIYLFEHPEEPDRTDAASVWRLPIMQFLLQLPEIRRSSVRQGLFGAPSSKPTCLVHLAMPHFDELMATWQLCDVVPATVSIGRQQDGTYRTARLKEYPPALCRGIAWSLCHHIGLFRTESMAIPNSFKDRCLAMQAEYGEFLGADFAAD